MISTPILPDRRPGSTARQHVLAAIARACAVRIKARHGHEPDAWQEAASAGIALLLEHEAAALVSELGDGVLLIQSWPFIGLVRGQLKAVGYDLGDAYAVEDLHRRLVDLTLDALHGRGQA